MFNPTAQHRNTLLFFKLSKLHAAELINYWIEWTETLCLRTKRCDPRRRRFVIDLFNICRNLGDSNEMYRARTAVFMEFSFFCHLFNLTAFHRKNIKVGEKAKIMNETILLNDAFFMNEWKNKRTDDK